jgi:L-seryl-tRNA(Ser) seleniumtransferase
LDWPIVMTRELLRSLPGIDAWLSSEQGMTLCAEYSRDEVVVVMRKHLARIRGQLRNGGGELPALTGNDYTNLLRADLLERRSGTLKPVINATGIVIHTNLGRAPLADEAIEAMTLVSRGYSNLEFDLDSGERGSRNAHAAGLISELTGAEAAMVVNNCAAAVLFVLHAFAGSGEVIVSRGELIEIGGSFRMPDVIAASGARMVEVGTTNRTTTRDYAAALSDDTRVLLTSHPSNYRIVGFTASADPRELKALANDKDLVLVQDLGSGSLCRLDRLAAHEPTVADCIADGADIVTFSGDKLLGGPQAGIIAGRADLIDRLRRHPFARALRIDKLSLAALTATLKLYQPPHDPFERIPVLRMIAEQASAIGRRAARIAKELEAIDGVTASVADDVSFAGGGALPMNEIATKVIRLEVAGFSAAELAAALRAANPPVIGRISNDAVTLDLRTVQPGQTNRLVGIIRDALA